MNICIESQLLNHPRRSGVMTYTEGLINGMKKIDQENQYTLAYYSLTRPSEDMPGPKAQNIQKAVMKVPDREFFGRQKMIDCFFLPSLFSREKIDIFHRPVGYTIPCDKNVFTILTVHDLRTLTMNDQRWAQNIKQYERTLSEVNLVVVVSECTKQDLIKHFNMDEKKIKVVYLGADERYQRADDQRIEEVKKSYGIEKPFFLAVGSVPRKNIDGIIRGFKKCKYNKDFQLILNCRFDVEKYQAIIDELGLNENVSFIRDVGDRDLIALYSASHCFAFPSHYEGFGLPILEAMHCGTPVITSSISACPEVAADSALLVHPENTDEIGEAMDQVCSNEALRQSLIQKGYERAKQFSWDKFAGEMKEIYSSC